MKDHVTREQFLLEFFGPLGRELGDPNQVYTDNPMDIFPFMERCAEEKKPAFISVQPRTAHHNKTVFGVYGIEKIFYDFDYGRKSDKLTEKQIKTHRAKMEKEIRIFVHQLSKQRIIPLIVKTRKGYHIYIYFDRIYEISGDEDLWKEVYGVLYDRFIKSNKHSFKYADSTSRTDIFRLCRIPISIHQVTGKECKILDINFKPTKIRSLEYYKMYGLRSEDLKRAVEQAIINERKREQEVAEREIDHKENWEADHGYTGKIRPCFKVRMDAGEMCHDQRRALCVEAFYAGYNTPEKMMELFRCFNDWDVGQPNSVCEYQINYWFNETVRGGNKCKTKPYQCDTIREKKWCLGDECTIYRKQKEQGKIGKTKGKKA